VDVVGLDDGHDDAVVGIEGDEGASVVGIDLVDAEIEAVAVHDEEHNLVDWDREAG